MIHANACALSNALMIPSDPARRWKATTTSSSTFSDEARGPAIRCLTPLAVVYSTIATGECSNSTRYRSSEARSAVSACLRAVTSETMPWK